MRITIDFKNGLAVPDNMVLSLAEELLGKGEDFSIASDLLMTAIRVQMRRKDILHSSLEVYSISRHETYYLSEGYTFYNYPEELEVWDTLLSELIGWML